MLYNNRNHIEIEKKYVFDDRNVFHEVLTLLEEWGEYGIDTFGECKSQTDYYYDTKSGDLFNGNKTLRFRKRDEGYQLTIKMPTKANPDKNSNINSHVQSERFEFEMPVISEDKEDNKHYITKYLTELSDDSKWTNLHRTLTVANNREKIHLSKGDVKFEMVFDHVTYINENGRKNRDYQIEIELKSNYIHRVNLKMLSDYLESNIPALRPINESNYNRCLTLTTDD